jgi:dephospho-CoA kinase
MLVVGLTGSLAMGKSVTARLFAEAGVPVHDADAAVRRLYAGEAVPLIEAAFPGTSRDGTVDRAALAAKLCEDEGAIERLEAIVHPLVQASEKTFLAEQIARGARIALLDIPLLFETGAERRVDIVVVVSAPPEIQRARAFARAGMTPAKFAFIMARQLPDSEKRRRAHFVVDSSRGIDSARGQVRGILRAVAAVPGCSTLSFLVEGERTLRA